VFERKLEVLGVSVATSRSNPLSKRKLDIFELPHGVTGAIRGVVGGDRGGKPSYFGVVTDQATAPWWLAVAEGLRAAPSWVLGATVGKAVDWGEATRSVRHSQDTGTFFKRTQGFYESHFTYDNHSHLVIEGTIDFRLSNFFT
jgi:hypothetical protein